LAFRRSVDANCLEKRSETILFAPLLKMSLLIMCMLAFSGCHENSTLLEPKIFYVPQERHIKTLPSPFEPLDKEEKLAQWGEETLIGQAFARELDLYRAITAYKRAKILIPEEMKERRWQIEYSIVLCYYLANKYQEAVESFEESHLKEVPETFPAYMNLLLVLYDSYQKMDNIARAQAIINLIEKKDPETARNVVLGTAIVEGELSAVRLLAEHLPSKPETIHFLNCYCLNAKSVRKAQTLNAFFPGAGYYYVGLKKSALTSLALNSLFAWAAYKFFDEGYTAAGIITLSFEAGWYIGGINGAGLAAKAYNQACYSDTMKEAMLREKLFPVLMFNYAF